ncbi:hypothetical protein LXL04_032524 [Taraxacum kok-saghyz]
MAEIAVTAVINVLCEKLISGDLMKLARSEGIDSQLQKWKKNLLLIQAVLADASQKHIKDKAVQLWVNDLEDLAYDIDDVLDEMATETIRRRLNQEASSSTSMITGKVLKFFPSCCTNLTPPKIMYGWKMSSELNNITTKLRDLVDQKNDLGLNVNVGMSNTTERRLEQTSLIDESKIMGREKDKDALLGKLLENDENVRIVSIIGMGGIGKTTIAKLLYNEEKVKVRFEVRAWVCVSEDLDVFNISKAIFQAVTGENKDFANLDLLHVALKEKLSKKRFLLVLDDVWNEDHSKWELLQNPLLVGAPGSKIIVTTRSTTVASVMDSEEAYDLEVLSNEDALSLFAQHAVGEKTFEKHPTLKLLGEGIVKKCGSLPLALKTLGRVLKGKRNVDEWEKLLKSEIWDIDDGSDILPALRLSYYHLPPHLKLLFAYCSLFPKDYEFQKKDLVLQWMAEGFLSKSKSMEELGSQYFEELKLRSVYSRSDGMSVFDKPEDCKKVRHFSLIDRRSYGNLKELHRAMCLRTFLPFSNYRTDIVGVTLFHKLRFLRVLSLHESNMTQVPQSLGSLKHLRYLNFSHTKITCLPKEVGDLYNLQSLLVHDCYELLSLPESFEKLINLRHLNINNTPQVYKLPLGIAGLTSLQTLPKVIIDDRFKISDLKCLSYLQGRLSIIGINKVKDPIQAMDAKLHEKKGLEVLVMEWSDVFDDSRNEMIEYEVLKELRPPPKLEKLEILNNKGARFPSWVGDPSFDHLTKITLCGCRSTHLPTLGVLGSLKELVVEKMSEVKTVGFELLGPTTSFLGVVFRSLEVLEFYDMQGWEKWSIDINGNHGTCTSFPCLGKIVIKRCPKLDQVSVGLIPSLRVLYVEECSKEVLRSMIGLSSSLVQLEISKVNGLTQLHGEDLIHLGAVKDLLINGCDELRYLWERDSEAFNSLVSLQSLEVYCCKELVSSAEKEKEKEVSFEISVESLKHVFLFECDTLESYNCPNTVESLNISRCGSMTTLTFTAVRDNPSSRLTSLRIANCKNLKSFPHALFQTLTSLKDLSVHHCPSMDYSFPCGLWPPNLSHLNMGVLNKPMSEWGVQNFPTSLVELLLYGENSGVVSFAVTDNVTNTTTSSSSFLLPPSLISLWLIGFEDVESFSEVLQHLPCLKRLDVQSCPKIRDLVTTSNPSNLTINVNVALAVTFKKNAMETLATNQEEFQKVEYEYSSSKSKLKVDVGIALETDAMPVINKLQKRGLQEGMQEGRRMVIEEIEEWSEDVEGMHHEELVANS